ncbi:chemotaxis protein [Candidatus Nitrososphaera evergladensis SR1]|uniref:Probable chemoreceptor glutamine deamidase CheD n=1 Tax=Candidatus Nitrososphaera evergladensis SR1 TaxID=1459636 RepID=A0A075MUP7_9ARCH|nr:chemotaxis protein CheD [Candidatus Nitrososphaera evergladensis]AIF84402.1 chemotaxis protein [Candidatus Nitrososphaera evergladensis SR1]
MDAETSVGMGELYVADKKDTVLTTFVGSCIALCLYDPRSKVGGMAHIMLPENGSRNSYNDSPSSADESAKYADEALENTLRMMVEKGALPGRLVAKIAGGAKIFSHEGSSDDMFSIGSRNTESIKRLLTQKGIKIAGEDVGLNHGRWVRFNLNSGRVVVSMRNSGEKVL